MRFSEHISQIRESSIYAKYVGLCSGILILFPIFGIVISAVNLAISFIDDLDDIIEFYIFEYNSKVDANNKDDECDNIDDNDSESKTIDHNHDHNAILSIEI